MVFFDLSYVLFVRKISLLPLVSDVTVCHYLTLCVHILPKNWNCTLPQVITPDNNSQNSLGIHLNNLQSTFFMKQRILTSNLATSYLNWFLHFLLVTLILSDSSLVVCPWFPSHAFLDSVFYQRFFIVHLSAKSRLVFQYQFLFIWLVRV